MKKIKRIFKFILYPFLPILYLIKDSFPTDQPLNIIKTIYVNYRALPIKQAIYLPIYIYRGVKIYKLGKIIINTPNLKRGMISIGRITYKSQGEGKLLNLGLIEFRGATTIGGGFIIENLGTIIFKGNDRLGEGVTLLIRDKLEIGKYSTLGFRCFLMDSDDHFTINCNTLEIGRNKKPIIIGRRNWIANSTYIKKGTITPDYTIVASANSLLSKDYSGIEPYSVLGGIPAKKIGSGIRRIYNFKEEARINKYFIDNPDIDIYIPNIRPEGVDEYCTSNFLD